MARTVPVRYSLLLLGGGSITAYAGSASLATAHLTAPASAAKVLSAQTGIRARVGRLQQQEAANSSAAQALSKAQGKMQSARATVLTLQQQLQTLQQQLSARGQSVPDPSVPATPVPSATAPQSSQPTYVAPSVPPATMPPASTMTGASGIP